MVEMDLRHDGERILLTLVRVGRLEESREDGYEIERNMSSSRTDIFGGFRLYFAARKASNHHTDDSGGLVKTFLEWFSECLFSKVYSDGTDLELGLRNITRLLVMRSHRKLMECNDNIDMSATKGLYLKASRLA